MIGIDTNILVRYLAQDDVRQSRAATRLMVEGLTPEQPGFISLVTLVELIWVLRQQYRTEREQLIEIVRRLLNAPNLVVDRAKQVEMAIALPHADLADCLIHIVGQSEDCTTTITFDKKFARLPGVELLK